VLLWALLAPTTAPVPGHLQDVPHAALTDTPNSTLIS
jgi:hypothetical protein